MASYTLSPIGGAGAQFFDNSGNVLSGGKLYTYLAGTTTPALTYTTPAGITANSNPIILNAAGRPAQEIWLSSVYSYKFVIKDSNDVLIATYDNIPGLPQPAIVNDASSISYEQGNTVTAGSFVVGNTYMIASLGDTDFVSIGAAYNSTGQIFVATGVGSGTGTAYNSQTVQEKLQQTVNVKDFGAVGDGVVDDTAAIQAAITSCTSNEKTLYVPSGTYLFSSQLVFTCNLVGEENKTTIFQASGSALSTTDYALCIGDSSGVTRRIQASNFTLFGDGSSTLNNGLLINSVWFSRFQSIRVGDFNGVGCKVNQQSYWNTFEDIEVGRDYDTPTQSPSTGLLLAGVSGAGVTATTFTSCYFSGSTYGVDMAGCDNLVFNNLEVSGSPIGVNCPSSNTNIQINALYAELCSTACIQGGSDSLFVNGISDTASAEIYVAGKAPTSYMKRSGTPSESWVIYKKTLVMNWGLTVNSDESLTLANSRGLPYAIKIPYGILNVNSDIGTDSPNSTYHQFKVEADTGQKVAAFNDSFAGEIVQIFNGRGGNSADSANAANAGMKVGNPISGRSINASGTINASGADYAEYMVKNDNFTIAKGDICGIDANGKLTNKFAEAVTFVVKSTDPSYVGNDGWDKQGIAQEQVDRIAFAGQVPVNVTGATAGDYIIPTDESGSIKGIAVSNPTFEQYQIAVGKVIAIQENGQPRIIVKVA